MKIFRRLALFCLLLGIVLIGAGFFVHNRVRQVPAWYRHLPLDEATQHLAAMSMNQKLLETYGKANDALSAAARARFDSTAAPTTAPQAEMSLELSETEINSFFADWDNHEHWRQRIARYVVDPIVILEDHEVIIAGTITDWNVVASLHFEPRLENGKLYLALKSVMAGTLEVPRSAIQGYLDKIEAQLQQKMPRWRENAEIGPRGWANSDAVAAAMGELVIHALHDEPAEPVVMFQEAIKSGSNTRFLPVQITKLEISDKSIRASLRTMTADEREALLQHLRGNPSPAIASVK